MAQNKKKKFYTGKKSTLKTYEWFGYFKILKRQLGQENSLKANGID